jgi:acetyl/propionyl-CoA carboxylase alpha subunit/acetyl-CoA carboxylase carboxyltransferase component
VKRSFQRVAIVNRGHVAMRFVTSARELNREHDLGLRTIALATDADRSAMFVREADEVVWLGASSFVDPRDRRRKSRYVDYARIREALLEANADAAWLGWGFVPEHLEGAAMCEAAGVRLIGPTPDAMRLLRNKVATRELARELGVPVVPGSRGAVGSIEEARHFAEEHGFPLMLKPAFGGAGRTLSSAPSMTELERLFPRLRDEADRSLGSPLAYLERRLMGARLVSVAILADSHGTVWDVGLRDGSVQRGFSKLLDEGPAIGLSKELEARLRAWAVAIMKAARYEGVGGVEFLVDAAGDEGWFLEVNPRLETAHDVLEATTGLDLVKQEILVARGERLEGAPPVQRGHAFEVHLRANDPEEAFAPATGTIELFRPPMGPGLRVEASVVDGDELPAGLSTLIAKLVAYGRTRAEALSRLERGLRDTTIVVRGGATNRSFLLALASREEVRQGPVDVDWLDAITARGELERSEHAGAALVIAAIELYDAAAAEERAAFLATAARGRPTVRPEAGHAFELTHRGRSYRVSVARRSAERYRVELGARTPVFVYERRGVHERRLTPDRGRALRAVVADEGVRFSIEVEGELHRVGRQEGGVVRAPTPGIVQSISVVAGARVALGDDLLVLEAMKMELRITAPFSGRVKQVHAVSNVPAPAGGPLITIERDVEGGAEVAGDLAVLDAPTLAPPPASPASPREGLRRHFSALRQQMLGYDVDAREAKHALAELPGLVNAVGHADDEVQRAERDLVRVLASLLALFRRRQGASPTGDDEPSAEEGLITFLRARSPGAGGLSRDFLGELRVAVALYDVAELEPSASLDEALFRIFRAHQRIEIAITSASQIIERWHGLGDAFKGADAELASLLDALAHAARGRHDALAELALEASYRLFAQPIFVAARRRAFDEARAHLAAIASGSADDGHLAALVDSPYPLLDVFIERVGEASAEERDLVLLALSARYYRSRDVAAFASRAEGPTRFLEAEMSGDAGMRARLLAALVDAADLTRTLGVLSNDAAREGDDGQVEIDVIVRRASASMSDDMLAADLLAQLAAVAWPRAARRATFVVASPTGASSTLTFTRTETGFVEDALHRGLHPMTVQRLHLGELSEFVITRLPAPPDVFLYRGVARKNPKDERLFAFAEVRDLTPVRGADGALAHLPHFERLFQEALAALRSAQALHAAPHLYWNRIDLTVTPPTDLDARDLHALAAKLAPRTAGADLEKVVLRARFVDAPGAAPVARVLEFKKLPGRGLTIEVREPDGRPTAPLTELEQKIVRARQRGLTYPWELLGILAPARGSSAELPPGDFVEHDLEGDALVPVSRQPGRNTANVIVGVVTSFTDKHPEGMSRVAILGDPSKNLGSLAEPECRRVLAALALSKQLGVPVEWFALSSGAKIAMDSGTENMDWIAAVLRGLIEHTQEGGEINIVVMGINVGGQPYWNAEATMLLHTKGILVMMPHSAMVLTGKRALDYSGGVSAEDDLGIGGYDRVMGPNGQAQYFARDPADACRVLLRHYEHTFVAKGERFPRRAPTTDPRERDIGAMPHGGELATIADVLSSEKNPGRKKPFHIRRVMAAAIDQDHAPLERWKDMRDAENAVVWDAHVGGYPVCLLGIESEPIARRGPVPADGPESFTGGTLFPLASKKIARAINAASKNRPVVILANLSGFDGSPESMRMCQLELGAEIGRAVVNFTGPIVFCVVSRFHGGAYVVFSRTLNENLEVVALEGTYASVIGGAPAAGVVFAGEVEARAKADPRVKALGDEITRATDKERAKLKAYLDELTRAVRAEKVGELAEQFDREHSVERALRVGSLHKIIPRTDVRPYLIDAIERGMARERARLGLT